MNSQRSAGEDATGGLSASARSVWAKSPDDTGAWLPLWQHMDDSSDVAGELFDNWLPEQVRSLLAADFGGDVGQARVAVRFLAGVHDLGKATPAFAVQSEALAQRMREHSLWMPTKNQLLDRQYAHHTVAGQQLLVRWLTDRGWNPRNAHTWAVVLGGHHGVPPDNDAISEADPDIRPDLYGRESWERVRLELLQRQSHRSGAAGRLDSWREVRLSQRFQVIATGLVIVSDWLASNADFFPYLTDHLPEPTWQTERANTALAGLKLPGPWRLPAPAPDTTALFSSRFELPEDASVRPVQRATVAVAEAMPEPGLLILEAPMGEGKTEAALAAGEVLARRWGAGGLFVALPTQATTDAMFTRIVDWLNRLGSGEQQVSGAITLSHGKARLNRIFRGLVRDGWRGEIGADEHRCGANHAVVAHGWLSGRKKGPLANFGIGTIDQLLFVGLKARHLMLRHLGMAGKVVIIDEIHAYDAFMNSYLTKVLMWLAAYRVPVIALSATLPADRRAKLAAAYHAGLDTKADEGAAAQPPDTGYPLITWTHRAQTHSQVTKLSGRSSTMRLERLPDELDQLADLLHEQLVDGGNALVVCNTVRRVLAAADRLEREFPGEVTLAHSRFIALDRMRNDEELLHAFGPPSRATERPYRRIVVASQVVEQSLDVDFDLLITDLAPMDLVLQRMGRVHRHQRGTGQSERPERLRTAQVWIRGADFDQQPPALDRGSRDYVYNAHTLLRSAAVLSPKFGGAVELPADIAPLVQAAYGPDSCGPAEWQDRMTHAEQKWHAGIELRESNARTFQIEPPKKSGKAINGWISANVGDADDDSQGQGQVRDGAPSLETMVIQRDSASSWHTPTWLSEGQANLPIPRDSAPSDRVAQVMASCTVRLPMQFSTERAEAALWGDVPEPWEHSPLIFRLPVLVLDADGLGEINRRRIRYTTTRGLEVPDDES